ncbi:MAG: tRNA lysidine(34) synthetase TilS, partial [Oscillospiraceae bacterium]|nr:tRNA lysidine(34) synthetase TilS [Oscillospiraceae bacterium]
MLRQGETVCCALSGGADSVALLLSMRELSEELGISLSAVHINHLLRGEESDRDENFCREL